jgi:hypothetical protein
MRLFLLAFLIGLCVPVASAQFDLQPGDLAIVGYYADDPDAIAVLALVDVAAGTEIAFTDRGWRAEGGFYDGPGDGTFRYTVPAPDHAAGEVFVLNEPSGIDLSSFGDQILVYTGPDDDPWFIYAFNFEGNRTWQADAIDVHTSALPPGLIVSYSAGFVAEIDNAAYPPQFITEGSRALLLLLLTGPYHERSDDQRLPFPDSLTVIPDEANLTPSVYQRLTRRELVEGRPLTHRFVAVDINGDPVSYSLAEAPAGATIDPVRGVFTWTPPPGSAGTTVRLLVHATDGVGTGAYFTYLDVVGADVNHPPQLMRGHTSIGTVLGPDVGVSSARIGLVLYDPEGDPASARLVSGPPSAYVSNGSLFWPDIQWDLVDGELGVYDFQIEVTDGSSSREYPYFVMIYRDPFEGNSTLFEGLTGAGLRAAIRDRFAPSLLSSTDAPDALFTDVAGFQYDEVQTAFANYRAPFDSSVDPSDALAERGVIAATVWPDADATADALRRDLHGLFAMREDVRDAWAGAPYAEIPDADATAWYLRDLIRSVPPTDSVYLWSEGAPGRFEPREAVKGDVARAVLYLATMYEEVLDLAVLGPQLETLLTWAEQDRAAYSYEVYRSGLVQRQQGNVNPFMLDDTLARRAFAALVSSDPVPGPSALSLSAAMPNPAAHAARLTLALPTAGHVRAEAFDLLGRRVQVLHDGPAPSGPLPLRLDAAALAPGVYVVRAATPAGMATQKVTVAR